MYLTLRTKEIQETIESYVRLSHVMTTNNTFGLTAPEQIPDMQAVSGSETNNILIAPGCYENSFRFPFWV